MKTIQRTSFVSTEKTMKWIYAQLDRYNSKNWSLRFHNKRAFTLTLLDVD